MDYSDIYEELYDLYIKKNSDYGSSFSKTFEEFGMTSVCIRLVDKINRLMTLCRKDAEVKDESIEDTLKDLANYSIMTLMELRKGEEKNENN